MRFTPRAAGLAVVAALTASVILFRPGSPPSAEAAQPALDTDLALVPTDAVGFVHVRAADLWKHELLAGFRKTFEKAGPKALAALDAQFVPKISTFDRVTAFVLLDERNRPLPYAVLRFSAPFSAADVIKAHMPGAEGTNVAGKTFWSSPQADFELHFPDKQHIVVGMPGTLERYLKHQWLKTGPMAYGLKLAASGKPVVASVNVAALPIPPRDLEALPAEVKPLLKAQHVTVSLDLAAAVKLDLVAGYKTAAEAEDAEKAIKALAEYARKELGKVKADIEKQLYHPKVKGPRPVEQLPETVFSVFAVGAINHLDDLLADPGALVKRNGSELSAGVTLPKELVAGVSGLAAFGTALAMPAVQKVRMAAARLKSQNNLRQIALACFNYESAYGHFPHDITDKDGKPLLSWRVAILPFMEQQNLYKQFRLDESWDSEHNKPLSDLAVKVFMSPLADPPTPPGMTHYKAFVGPGTAFERGKPIKILDFTDGTSNTILVVEAGDPVPWAKPEDIPFDPKKALPKLALPGVADFVNVAMCDGSVRTVNTTKLTEKTLKALITRNGDEPLAADWDKE